MPGTPSSVSSVMSPFKPPMSSSAYSISGITHASSPSFMSPRGAEPPSPMRQRQQQTLRGLAPNSSPIVGSPVWRVNREELGRLKRSSSFEMHGNVDEPDLAWVRSLVKESPWYL
ncbi:hypothetical protein ZIOFF_051683 [Zingiber officinale]|uniref:Uncharacterized protein n=1 Tax=Zingiber officinale TaxID=94328 RepID=A0A8J5FKX0_ZINOF|nr:hypothetical protein ZIOFF_051683 [Zingiber officinale]